MEPTPEPSRRSSECAPDEQPPSRHTPSEQPPKGRSSPPAPLHLSDLPPLSQPSPATNTLLLTNLNDADIFRPENLQTIRDLISQTSTIHTWSPLKSFRRIVVSFPSEEAAIAVRQIWDGEPVMGERCRVYFGTPTPVEARDEHLALPDPGKLFFISPPSSPPHDWEMRLEDAPNAVVHAEDLAAALASLHKKRNSLGGGDSSVPVSPTGSMCSPAFGRTRSSTLIYVPDETSTPGMPTIAVEVMEGDDFDQPICLDDADNRQILSHTARPPVELMQDQQ